MPRVLPAAAEDAEDDSADDSDGDLGMTPEMRKFLLASQQRRAAKERRKEQNWSEWQKDALKPAEELALRRKRLKRRYGSYAAEIEQLEDGMDDEFDQLCDRTNAPYWPVNPLKLWPPVTSV